MSRSINKNMKLSSMVVKWCNSTLKQQTKKSTVAVVLVVQNAIAAKGLPVVYSRNSSGKTLRDRYNKNCVSNKMLAKAVDTRGISFGLTQKTVLW